MRRLRELLAAASLVLLPVATVAQDKPEDSPDVGFISHGLLDVAQPEPLTPEQQARLPLARALADKVLPPGSMNSMMGHMFTGPLAPLAGEGEPDPYAVLTRRGIFVGPQDLSSERATRIAEMLDPAWQERDRRQRALTAQAMGRMMTALEPAVRQALAELYAVNFDAAQLADIDAFFATPSGAAYARQSYLMASDPRMTGTMMQIMPQVLGQMGAIEAEMAAALADLPPQRNHADLTSNQKKLLAQWLGMAVEDLEFTLIDGS